MHQAELGWEERRRKRSNVYLNWETESDLGEKTKKLQEIAKQKPPKLKFEKLLILPRKSKHH